MPDTYFYGLLQQTGLQVHDQGQQLDPGNIEHLLHHGYLQIFRWLRTILELT